MLLDDIEKNYPFISVVEYGGHEYVGVINNQDTAITSMFIFTDIPNAKSKEKFIEFLIDTNHHTCIHLDYGEVKERIDAKTKCIFIKVVHEIIFKIFYCNSII